MPPIMFAPSGQKEIEMKCPECNKPSLIVGNPEIEDRLGWPGFQGITLIEPERITVLATCYECESVFELSYNLHGFKRLGGIVPSPLNRVGNVAVVSRKVQP